MCICQHKSPPNNVCALLTLKTQVHYIKRQSLVFHMLSTSYNFLYVYFTLKLLLPLEMNESDTNTQQHKVKVTHKSLTDNFTGQVPVTSGLIFHFRLSKKC